MQYASKPPKEKERYADNHRNSSFASVERATQISTLAKDMAISSSSTNNCRSSYRASRYPFFPARTSPQRRRASLATAQQKMTVDRSHHHPRWERGPPRKSAGRRAPWPLEAFLTTADLPLDHLAGLRWDKGPSRPSHPLDHPGRTARRLCFTERSNGFPSVRSSVQCFSKNG